MISPTRSATSGNGRAIGTGLVIRKVAASNPAGPELVSLHMAYGQTPSRVIKDRSYLCSMNCCSRFRPAARQLLESDLVAAHLGFRTVLNKPNPGRLATRWTGEPLGSCVSKYFCLPDYA
jgi:hypothetical protein